MANVIRKRFKPMRQRRYESLIKSHFTPSEAAQLSKQRKLNTPLMIHMKTERAGLYYRFNQTMKRKSKAPRTREWHSYLGKWYTRKKHVDRKGKPNIWSWRDSILDRLSPEDRHMSIIDTPRPHRKGAAKWSSVSRVQYTQWIDQKKKTISKMLPGADKTRAKQELQNLVKARRRASK